MDTNIRPLQSYAAARLFHARGTTDLTTYVPDKPGKPAHTPCNINEPTLLDPPYKVMKDDIMSHHILPMVCDNSYG